ncbi:hypothetical protein LXL04_000632 [Taraxacum kok-saghyz]
MSFIGVVIGLSGVAHISHGSLAPLFCYGYYYGPGNLNRKEDGMPFVVKFLWRRSEDGNTIGTPFPVHLLSLPHPAAILPHSQRRTPSDEEHHRRSSPSSVPVARSSPSSVPVAFFPILFLCHFSEIRPPSSIACFFPILFLCHFSEFKSKRKRKPNEFKSIRKEEMIDSSSNQIQIQTKTFKRSIRVQIRSKSKRKPSPLSSISCWSDSGKLSSEAKKKEVKLSGEAKKKEGEEPDSSHFRFFLQFQSDDILICPKINQKTEARHGLRALFSASSRAFESSGTPLNVVDSPSGKQKKPPFNRYLLIHVLPEEIRDIVTLTGNRSFSVNKD